MLDHLATKYRTDTLPWWLRPPVLIYGYGGALLFFLFARLVQWTSRVEVVGTENLQGRTNHILCFWHTFIPLYFILFPRHRRHAWMQHPFWYMKPIHALLRLSGVDEIVLGSTGHSGQEAAANLAELLDEGYSTVILPDGPAGPRGVARRGALHLSLQTGVPIIPMRFEASRCVRGRGWDRKHWPLPFAAMKVHYGPPIGVDEDLDAAAERLQLALSSE